MGQYKVGAIVSHLPSSYNFLPSKTIVRVALMMIAMGRSANSTLVEMIMDRVGWDTLEYSVIVSFEEMIKPT